MCVPVRVTVCVTVSVTVRVSVCVCMCRTHVCVYYNLCINLSCCLLGNYTDASVQLHLPLTPLPPSPSLYLSLSHQFSPTLLLFLAFQTVTNAKRATNCPLLMPESLNFQLQNVHMIGMMITCLKIPTHIHVYVHSHLHTHTHLGKFLIIWMHLLRTDYVSWVSCLSGPVIRATDSFCSELHLVVIAPAILAFLVRPGPVLVLLAAQT